KSRTFGASSARRSSLSGETHTQVLTPKLGIRSLEGVQGRKVRGNEEVASEEKPAGPAGRAPKARPAVRSGSEEGTSPASTPGSPACPRSHRGRSGAAACPRSGQ